MGRDNESERGNMARITDGASGALVGWTAHDLGDRVILRVQTRDGEAKDANGAASTYLMMTKTQAVQLGNFLYQVSGQTPPRTKRGLLEQLLG